MVPVAVSSREKINFSNSNGDHEVAGQLGFKKGFVPKVFVDSGYTCHSKTRIDMLLKFCHTDSLKQQALILHRRMTR